MRDRKDRTIRSGGEGGFTLAEVLVATTLSTMVLLGLYLLYDVNQATFIRGEQRTDLQQNARIGMDRLVRELRLAGNDPSGVLTGVPTIPGGQDNCSGAPAAPLEAIENAEHTCIRFYADVDPTPPAGTTERVEYSYDAANQLLRRRQWDVTGASNGAQPLAERVTALTFAYYDDANNCLGGTCGIPPVAVPLPELGNIRRISVLLRTQDTQTGSVPQPFDLRGEVRPRNMGLSP